MARTSTLAALMAVGNSGGLSTPGRAFLFLAQLRQHGVDVWPADITAAGKPV